MTSYKRYPIRNASCNGFARNEFQYSADSLTVELITSGIKCNSE